MKLEFSRNIFEKCSNVKVHDNISIGSRVVSWELTHRYDKANNVSKNSSVSEIINYRNTKPKLSLLSQ